MIVTVIALAIIAIYCSAYFPPLLDYLMSEYAMAKRISPKIASEDLKKVMPDFVDLFSSIISVLGIMIIVLKLLGVGIEYLSGAIIIFAITAILFFLSLIKNFRYNAVQALKVLVIIVLVIIVCAI